MVLFTQSDADVDAGKMDPRPIPRVNASVNADAKAWCEWTLSIESSDDAWNEYTDVNGAIHTQCECQHSSISREIASVREIASKNQRWRWRWLLGLNITA